MLYNITESLIDNQGYQYICGMLETPKFNEQNLWHNTRAFDILVNHRKETTVVSTFDWINGAACNFKVVTRIKGETISVSEIERVLKECNLI